MSEPASTGASSTATTNEIVRLGFTHAIVIPDSESRLLVESLHGHDQIEVISPCREGESIAIAAGLWTGGKKPLLILQNTGLMESGDALRGCGIGPKIPLRMMVGWRGYTGAIAGRPPMDSAYPYTERLLDAWRIPTWKLMTDNDLGVLAEMDQRAAATSLPAAVLTGHAFTS